MTFTIEIGEDWIDTLEGLIETILNGSPVSLEEALEKTVFAQIAQQTPQETTP